MYKIHAQYVTITAIRKMPECLLLLINMVKHVSGPYHPLGIVPKTYDIFRAYEVREGRKIKK
jgi:hypothetical protein